MADERLVKQLKKSVATWNAWRQSEFHETLDLRRARLRDVSLSGADLSGVDLSEADLFGADLQCVDLYGADLHSANLEAAILTNARLSLASLRYSNLRGTDLSRANLDLTNLVYANLFGANFTETHLLETIFADVDLNGVIGLETCIHSGPSIIDHRTLQNSPSLPLSFLRGVGLPDNFIDYLPSLLGQAIQYYSCFISYSSKDQDFADRLHADLQDKGVRCWFAPHDLPIGGKIHDEIDAAIRMRDKVLLILSEHSIQSEWVEDEVKTAYEEERKRGEPMLFPIRLDDAVMDTKEAWAAKLRADRHIGDFRRWKEHDA